MRLRDERSEPYLGTSTPPCALYLLLPTCRLGEEGASTRGRGSPGKTSGVLGTGSQATSHGAEWLGLGGLWGMCTWAQGCHTRHVVMSPGWNPGSGQLEYHCLGAWDVSSPVLSISSSL